MIDLKDFKKVSEDKNSATLQHPKGHKITVIVSKLTPIQKEHLKRLDMCKPERLESSRKEYEKGTPDEPVSQNDNAPSTPPAPVTINVEGGNSPPQPSEQIKPQPIAGAQAIGNTGALPAAVPGVEQEEIAQQQQEKIGAEQAKQNAINVKANIEKRQELANQDAENADDLTEHADDFNEFIQKHPIRPNAYFQDMSAPQRVTNAIGMLLAGAGGGGVRAMDFLNKQIDRNVAAQQQDINNQGTIFHAYEKLYHDQNIASSLAKASNIDIMDNQMKLTAQRLGTAQAIQNYNAASGALKVKRAQEIGMAAQRLSGIKNGTIAPNPGPAGQEEMQKQQQEQQKPGGGEAGASVMPEKGPEKVSILNPDAIQHYKNLAFTPKAKDQYAEITKQYDQAVQSQKALDAIAEKFPQLREESTLSGNISSKINPHGVAAVAGALGAGLGAAGAGGLTAGMGAYPGAVAGATVGAGAGEGIAHAAKSGLEASGGQQQVRYEADRASLTKIIAAALRGTNVSSDQIQDVVDSNVPSYWDSKETYRKKMKNVQDFIKQNTETGLLKTWGLSKE